MKPSRDIFTPPFVAHLWSDSQKKKTWTTLIQLSGSQGAEEPKMRWRAVGGGQDCFGVVCGKMKMKKGQEESEKGR